MVNHAAKVTDSILEGLLKSHSPGLIVLATKSITCTCYMSQRQLMKRISFVQDWGHNYYEWIPCIVYWNSPLMD